MAGPRFSVVIPTRNRARTLAYALQTCLCQAFEDFEVVVSDNFSPPETRQVVQECGDRRVRYVRTPADLAMTDSLEFAVGQAAGEYVTVIGDDDGLLPHSLAEIDRILHLEDMAALRWESVLYNWPDVARQDYCRPNDLVIPTRLENAHHAVYRYESAPRMRAAADGALSYADLPMIYNSAVRRDVYLRLKRQTGRVFRGRTPDVYSAFAVAYAAGGYHSTIAPLCVAGASGQSTGVACIFLKGRTAVAEQFRKSNDAAGLVPHPTVPDLPPLSCYTADAFLYAKEALFPDDDGLTLDRRRLIANCLREVRADGEAEWRLVLAECRRSLGDDPALVDWFDREHAASTAAARRGATLPQARRRFGGTYLCLDAAEFGVADVAGAARLCELVLGYRRDGLNPRVVDKPADAGAPLSELQEKEAVIQGLDRAVKAMEAALLEKETALQALHRAVRKREDAIRALEEFRACVLRPLRRGVPRILRKALGRVPPEKPAA